MSTRRSFIASAPALALAALSGRNAFAQTGAYPDRPIKVVVPFPPGGSADIMGRMVADGLKNAFGNASVVENRPGAGANIGTEYVARPESESFLVIIP